MNAYEEGVMFNEARPALIGSLIKLNTRDASSMVPLDFCSFKCELVYWFKRFNSKQASARCGVGVALPNGMRIKLVHVPLI